MKKTFNFFTLENNFLETFFTSWLANREKGIDFNFGIIPALRVTEERGCGRPANEDSDKCHLLAYF